MAKAPRRKRIPDKVKWAAALLTIVRPDEFGRLVRVISHEAAKRMSVKQILAHYEYDHWPVRKRDGGPDEPWNLTPRPVLEHRAKTAKIDAPQIAKDRKREKLARVNVTGELADGPASAAVSFRQRNGAASTKTDGASIEMCRDLARAQKPKSRPMPGSRASAYKHKMSGKWERR